MKVFIASILSCALIFNAQAVVFEECDLMRILANSGVSAFSRDKLADWSCLILHESSYNSRAVGPPNSDGSRDFGLFQINSRYWCGIGGPGGDCNIDCNSLSDDNISDDIQCAAKIFGRHGFEAWYGWTGHCRGQPLPNINRCF